MELPRAVWKRVDLGKYFKGVGAPFKTIESVHISRPIHNILYLLKIFTYRVQITDHHVSSTIFIIEIILSRTVILML